MYRAPAPEPITFLVYSKGDKTYVRSKDGGYGWNHTEFSKLWVNGKRLTSTFLDGWYESDGIPTTVTEDQPPSKKNIRWELKPEITSAGDAFPKLLTTNPYSEDHPQNAVCRLYTEKYETVNNPPAPREFSLKFHTTDVEFQHYKKNPEFKDIQHNLGDMMDTHPSLLSARPCSLSGKDIFPILKEQVNLRIDRNIAEITSNYDFVLKVVRVLRNSSVQNYVNILRGKGKREYWEKKPVHTSVAVLHVVPTPEHLKYEGSSLIPTIHGKNHEDLTKNVEAYIDGIIAEINTPICECPTCSGYGFIKQETK